jgi:signal transduction histidine kinase
VFVGVAGVLAPMLSAIAAAPALHALGDPFWSAAYQWFLGDALVQVIVTPMILDLLFRRPKERVYELFVLLILVAMASLYVFVASHESHPLSLMYIPVPFLIWAAVRLRLLGTASAISVMAVVSMIGASHGTGLFADDAARHSVLSLQLLLLMSSLSLLPLSILIAEREALRDRERAFNGRLLDAREHERARIARELHDDIGQRMALLQIDLEQFRRTGDLSAASRLQIDGFTQTTGQIFSGIRALSHELHPAALDIVGLDIAVKGLCRELAERHRLQVEYSCSELPEHIERAVNLCLFRIAQEALHNVVKHSGAITALVTLSCDGDRLRLLVSDRGIGFDVDAADQRSGLGLISIRERLRPFGGTLSIRSRAGAGTQIHVEVPVHLSGSASTHTGTARWRVSLRAHAAIRTPCAARCAAAVPPPRAPSTRS